MMRKKRDAEHDDKNLDLFSHSGSAAQRPDEPEIKRLNAPVWTENKARFISLYLYYFVLITKHGTYIDACAGPQDPDHPETWAAKLVLDREPRFLRHFFLFDIKPDQVERLDRLKARQPSKDSKGRKLQREIVVEKGDCNRLIPALLDSGVLRKEATFCLLDQRTFECHWATVEALAHYKEPQDTKIEIFYFLASGWLGRALKETEDDAILAAWWGRDDWANLRSMTGQQILEEMVARFHNELNYRSVKSWPIFDKKTGGRVMYHMLHATDHPEAPTLMARAYNRATRRREPPEQFLLWARENIPGK